jgi:hypothetical protein
MKNIISCSIFLYALALLLLPFRCVADTAICHVVDPTGKPVANATVYVVSNPLLGASDSTLTTDKSGNFTVDAVGSGEFRLYMIDAPGYAPSGGTVVAGDNTFTLGLPTKLTGKVVDSKGQPIAGTTVCAQFASTSDIEKPNPGPQRISFFMMEPFTSRYTVKTDSAGKYTLDGLPADSVVSVELNDPRYIADAVMTAKGAGEAPLLTAEPGTSISGKVVRQDGKPIETGIQVLAGSTNRNSSHIMPPNAKVAADGTYKIIGIAPGTYTIALFEMPKKSQEADWVGPTPVAVTATMETPGVAPDLVLDIGGTVTGTVLDMETKKPIPDVNVTFQDISKPGATRAVNGTTDADGKFTAHVWGGKINVNIYNTPDDYASDPNVQQLTVTSVAGQTVNMDPILLKRAAVATGVAVDDSGKPVPNISLATQRVQQEGIWINIPPSTTNDNGAFSIHHLISGEFWIDAGAGWTVVSPKTFTVPLTSPITLVLKKNVTAAVQGTIFDTSNVPVPGVDVAFNILHDTPLGYRTTTKIDVTSGTDGTYTVSDAPVDFTMVQRVSVTKDGYIFKSGGDVSASNGKVVVSPILMAQLGGKVNGIIYNGLGKPVAGAWVFSPDSGSEAAPVQTDSAGHFELSNLAVGTVNVYAAKGMFFNQSSHQAAISPANTSIRLPAVPIEPIGPPNLTKAIVMLTKNINDQTAKKDHDDGSWPRDQAAHIIAEVSPDAAVRFILSISSISTWDLGSIVSARTDSDPIGIASWALIPIKRMSDNNGRGQTAATIGIAVAPYDAAAASAYYDIAAQYIHFDNLDQGSLDTAMKLTALAYLLHRPEADDDYAKVSTGLDALMKKTKSDPSTASVSDWLPGNLARTIAFASVDKAIAILSAQPENNRYGYVSGIIGELIKPNPAAAMAVYHWIAQETVSNYSQWEQGKALCDVLPIIYKTDPKGAIAQAHTIADPGIEATGLTDLADLMPVAKAAPFYQEAEEKATVQNGSGYSPACVANHAWQRDQVLGAKLFKIAFKKFIADTTNNPNQMFGQGPSYSDFAFYYSRIDPAYCRLLLESQFAKNNRNGNQDLGGDSVEPDVAAMCAIDINRAAELANEISTAYVSYGAGLKPAQYLLLTPQQRNTIPFPDWANDSSWVPGAPVN